MTIEIGGVPSTAAQRKAILDELGAASSASVRLPVTRRWAVLGDSIASQNGAVTATTNYLNAKGFLVQALMRMGWPAYHDNTLNFATSGANSGQMIEPGGQVDSIVAANATTPIERVFISMGTNDPGNGLTYAQSIGNLAIMFTRLRDAGIIPVYTCVLPRGNDGAMTDAKRHRICINSWAFEYARVNPWLEVIDCGVNLSDNANAFGNILSTHSADLLHPGDTGAELMGISIADYYGQRLGSLFRPLAQRGDVYNAAFNPGGVCFESPNPMLVGTGGALAGGATGVVPDGHTGTGGVWSKGTQTLANGLTRDTAIVTLAAATTHHLYDDATAVGAWANEGPLPGDRIYGACRVRLANTVNVSIFKLQMSESDGATTFSVECGNQDGTSPAKLAVGATPREFWLVTPDLVVRPYAGSGNCSLFMRMNCTTLAGGAGTMEVLDFWIRKRIPLA